MAISLAEILSVYRDTVEGIRQQFLTGEYDYFLRSFPREPLFVARGLEAAFGFKIRVRVVDFYEGLDDIPVERRDFFSFYEYRENDEVRVYLNSNKVDGLPLVSKETVRFILLKEMFNAVLRKAITKGLVQDKGPFSDISYPDTVGFAEFMSAHLDWISEKFSVYAFDSGEYSPTVSVENAAELLAILFIIDIPALYAARRQLDIVAKSVWNIDSDGGEAPDSEIAERRYSLFDYEQYAVRYEVKVRLIIVLVKTDFIIKIVEGLREVVANLEELGLFFSEPLPEKRDPLAPVILSNINGQIYLPAGDHAAGERLRAAAARFLEILGYEVPDVHHQASGSGSWWGKVVARVRAGVSNEQVLLRAKIAEDVLYGTVAVESAVRIAKAIADLAAAMQDEQCALDLGLFVMVRVVDGNGRFLTLSKRLTVRERALLDAQPSIIQNPGLLLANLGHESMAVLSGPQ